MIPNYIYSSYQPSFPTYHYAKVSQQPPSQTQEVGTARRSNSSPYRLVLYAKGLRNRQNRRRAGQGAQILREEVELCCAVLSRGAFILPATVFLDYLRACACDVDVSQCIPIHCDIDTLALPFPSPCSIGNLAWLFLLMKPEPKSIFTPQKDLPPVASQIPPAQRSPAPRRHSVQVGISTSTRNGTGASISPSTPFVAIETLEKRSVREVPFQAKTQLVNVGVEQVNFIPFRLPHILC